MSNPTSVVTERRLGEFYQEILPYLGGSADAGFTPVGSVIAVMGVTAPANYLACDGTVYNISDYPELANYFEQQFGTKYKFGGSGTTFGIPDLRGEFLRGTGTNSHTNQGSGADVGTHQDATENLWITRYRDAINPDNNLLVNSDIAKNDPSSNLQPRNSDSMIAERLAYHNIKITSSTVDSSQSVSRYTVRPTNTSILWCIATKDIYLNPSMDYSTDEKVVGTWIDGKTLYQKTLVGKFGTITDGTETRVTLDISSLNVELAFISEAFIFNGSNIQTLNDTYGATAQYQIRSLVSLPNQNVTAFCNRSAHSNSDVYITLRYTKTN